MTLAVLDTTRLLLRQLKETDVSAIYSLRSNEQVNQFIDRPAAKDPEEAKAFIQKITENKSYYWGITLKENGEMKTNPSAVAPSFHACAIAFIS